MALQWRVFAPCRSLDRTQDPRALSLVTADAYTGRPVALQWRVFAPCRSLDRTQDPRALSLVTADGYFYLPVGVCVSTCG